MAMKARNFFKPRNAQQYNFTQDCDSNVLQGNGTAIPFTINSVTPPVGTLINEFVANALKHAFPHGRGGNISIVVR